MVLEEERLSTEKIKITIDMPIRINSPDKYGRVLSEEAATEAVRHMEGVPICVGVRNIGVVEAAYISSVQDNCVNIRVFASIPHGGISYMESRQSGEDSPHIDISEVYLFE